MDLVPHLGRHERLEDRCGRGRDHGPSAAALGLEAWVLAKEENRDIALEGSLAPEGEHARV